MSYFFSNPFCSPLKKTVLSPQDSKKEDFEFLPLIQKKAQKNQFEQEEPFLILQHQQRQMLKRPRLLRLIPPELNLTNFVFPMFERLKQKFRLSAVLLSPR